MVEDDPKEATPPPVKEVVQPPGDVQMRPCTEDQYLISIIDMIYNGVILKQFWF